MPGFYVAFGDAVDAAAGDGLGAGPILRYYWHLMSRTALRFMATATSILNGSGIPFWLKVVNDPAAYRRADAGVLYVGRRDRPRIEPLIAEIHSRPGLRPAQDTPLFTRRCAGLGFAEGPG